MLIGWKSNRMKFNLFDGPFVVLGIYLLLGWIILFAPKSLADQIAKGVDDRDKPSVTLLNIPLKTKRKKFLALSVSRSTKIDSRDFLSFRVASYM